MAVNRKVPTPTTDPGGISGTSYANQVSEEVEALWRFAIEPLTSVAGTNTITASPLVSTLSSLQAGNNFILRPANTNTGAVTLNISSLGAKSVVSKAGSALSASALTAGTDYLIRYDGTNFRVLA